MSWPWLLQLLRFREHHFSSPLACLLLQVMAELFGKKTGCSRGQGGSMHLFDREHGLVRRAGAGPRGCKRVARWCCCFWKFSAADCCLRTPPTCAAQVRHASPSPRSWAATRSSARASRWGWAPPSRSRTTSGCWATSRTTAWPSTSSATAPATSVRGAPGARLGVRLAAGAGRWWVGHC